MFSSFAVVTNDPVNFMTFLKMQDGELHRRVAGLIVFEEVASRLFRLQKLYQRGIWDHTTETTLDRLWRDYCSHNY